jgi:hypothetical protein
MCLLDTPQRVLLLRIVWSMPSRNFPQLVFQSISFSTLSYQRGFLSRFAPHALHVPHSSSRHTALHTQLHMTVPSARVLRVNELHVVLNRVLGQV